MNPPRSRRASRSITLVIFASLRGCSTMGRSEIHTCWYRYGPPPSLQTLVRRPGTRYRGICCDAGSHTRDRGWNHPAGRKQYQCCALVVVQFGSLASEFRRCRIASLVAHISNYSPQDCSCVGAWMGDSNTKPAACVCVDQDANLRNAAAACNLMEHAGAARYHRLHRCS
jgi:hypothetical protein